MQPISEIEQSYNVVDPWQYQSNPDDINRKKILCDLSLKFGPYERVLDIGAGEGWITSGYHGKEIYGLEVSNQAASRFPDNVKRVLFPQGKYDLICATGIFYPHYNWPFFMRMIKDHASKHVLVSSIDSWELPCVNEIGKEIHRVEYNYREWKQRTRVFEV